MNGMNSLFLQVLDFSGRSKRPAQHNFKKLQIKFGEASQKKQIHVSCVPWYDVLFVALGHEINNNGFIVIFYDCITEFYG